MKTQESIQKQLAQAALTAIKGIHVMGIAGVLRSSTETLYELSAGMNVVRTEWEAKHPVVRLMVSRLAQLAWDGGGAELSDMDDKALAFLDLDARALSDCGSLAKTGAVEHSHDVDCTVGADGSCLYCGVAHGDPCEECHGRGFHNPSCGYYEPTMDDPCADCGALPGGKHSKTCFLAGKK